MAKLTFAGPIGLRLRSLARISRISMTTALRHAMGRRMAPDWDAQMETGIRFVRHQFTRAMTCGDMAWGRLLFDSVQPETDDRYEVTSRAAEGIDAVAGEHLLVAANETAEAEMACQLIADADHRDQLGKAARRLVENRYSWEAQLAKLPEICGFYWCF